MGGLAGLLFSLGAPILAKVVANQFGQTAGTLAQGVLKSLGEALGTPPEEPAIEAAIRARDMQVVTPIVQRIEQDLEAQMRIIGTDLADYRQLLREDQKTGGILARVWRPIFALVFTICFFIVVLTISRAVWISDVAALEALIGLATFLGFLFSAGCAVLGVYVWGRSGEKKLGAD